MKNKGDLKIGSEKQMYKYKMEIIDWWNDLTWQQKYNVMQNFKMEKIQ